MAVQMTRISSITICRLDDGSVTVHAMDEAGMFVDFEVKKEMVYHHDYKNPLSEFSQGDSL